jgi:hypothetical protein
MFPRNVLRDGRGTYHVDVFNFVLYHKSEELRDAALHGRTGAHLVRVCGIALQVFLDERAEHACGPKYPFAKKRVAMEFIAKQLLVLANLVLSAKDRLAAMQALAHFIRAGGLTGATCVATE